MMRLMRVEVSCPPLTYLGLASCPGGRVWRLAGRTGAQGAQGGGRGAALHTAGDDRSPQPPSAALLLACREDGADSAPSPGQASRCEILLRGRGLAAAKQLTGIALWVATVVVSDRIWCAGTIGIPAR